MSQSDVANTLAHFFNSNLGRREGAPFDPEEAAMAAKQMLEVFADKTPDNPDEILYCLSAQRCDASRDPMADLLQGFDFGFGCKFGQGILVFHPQKGEMVVYH